MASDPQTESFVKGLVDRGEAAKADGDGKLPPGATHEIVGDTETGLPIVVRRRFSAFGLRYIGSSHEPSRTDHWTHYLPGFR